jgi:hypothetical protein
MLERSTDSLAIDEAYESPEAVCRARVACEAIEAVTDGRSRAEASSALS